MILRDFELSSNLLWVATEKTTGNVLMNYYQGFQKWLRDKWSIKDFNM